MIYNNTLFVFIFHHHQNRICNKNIRSIQDIMRMSEPGNDNNKKVCDYFPNIATLSKSATPGKVQLAFMYASVGGKYLG